MRRLIALVRHPAVADGAGLCYGRLDLPVANPGSIAPIVAALAPLRGATIHTSPLARCRLVAEALAAGWSQPPPNPDPRLLEMDFGAWEGLAWDDIPGAALDRWAADLLGFAAPGGETGAALVDRVTAFWHSLTERPGAHVVVTHGGPLKVLIALADGHAVDLSLPALPIGAIHWHEPRQPQERRPMFTLADLEAAQRAVHAVFPGTPQYAWPLLAERIGAEVWVKHENHTPTGAFKVRGGLIHMERLSREQPGLRGVISATRGNHGQSLAFAGQRFGIPVTIVVPHGNSREKNAAMRALGARLIEHGHDFDSAKVEAVRLADAEGLTFAPSFHPDLVRGVATWALELFRAVADLDVLYVPIGLGSGICGAILARDLLGLGTEIVGVQSAGADAYARSLAAGQPVALDSAETLADGLAVRVPDPAAFAIIRAGVSRIVTVTDDEVAEAIRVYWTDTHNLAEGAGAAPLAAVLRERAGLAGRRVGVPLCGGNIDLTLFRRWILS